MCASQVRLFGENRLDSTGMLVARDGSSKQRGHGRPPEDFPVAEEVLFPSGSAALYRRTMLEELGGFDGGFFLYCEDTDLGLRARWAGWKCLYAPGAVVEHHYSHSAGRASPLKAYFVERNRLFVLVKNYPARDAAGGAFRQPRPVFVAPRRFCCAARAAPRDSAPKGHAGPKMAWYVLKAHAVLPAHFPRLFAQRRQIRERARITPAIFRHLIRSNAISAQKGGRTLIRPQPPDRLLIIVPAWNEEGAVAQVVESIHQHVPGTPVLVIDDSSTDSTVRRRAAPGAAVLPLPHHLGLGGCVQAGYKLAYELGFDYVIRVDGDGQHDARDIPRVLDALRSTGCEMAIGSRFVEDNGATHERRAGNRDPVFPDGAAADPGPAGARPDFRFRRREPARAGSLQPQLSAGISGDRSAGGAAAEAVPFRGGSVQDAAADDGPFFADRV